VSAEQRTEPDEFIFDTPATEHTVIHGSCRRVLFQVFNEAEEEIFTGHETVDNPTFKILMNRAIKIRVVVFFVLLTRIRLLHQYKYSRVKLNFFA